MLASCPECGNPCAQDAVACPRCGKPNPAAASQGPAEELVSGEVSVWRRQVSSWQAFIVIGMFLLAGGAWFAGTYHIVRSSHGTRLVEKAYFTFAETFVSLDAITGQPAIVAESKYPLAVKALQREGILESDSAREERLQGEMKEEMEKNRREVEAEMQKALGK